MKVFTPSLIAAALIATIARADVCDTASMTALLTSSEVATCASGSGYSLSSLNTPNTAEMEMMCSDIACQTVLSDLTTMFPEECTVGTFALYADLITPMTTHCSGVSTSSSSTTGSAESNEPESTSTASADSESAITSSASYDSAEVVTVDSTTQTTSSASLDSALDVGDSGDDPNLETQTPSSESASASTTADSPASAPSAADDTYSGSSVSVTVAPSAALLGSALVATAALFL